MKTEDEKIKVSAEVREIIADEIAVTIKKEGRGKEYWIRTGKFLWNPDKTTLRQIEHPYKIAFRMEDIDRRIVAYWIDGQVIVCHDDSERDIVDKMLKEDTEI